MNKVESHHISLLKAGMDLRTKSTSGGKNKKKYDVFKSNGDQQLRVLDLWAALLYQSRPLR